MEPPIRSAKFLDGHAQTGALDPIGGARFLPGKGIKNRLPLTRSSPLSLICNRSLTNLQYLPEEIIENILTWDFFFCKMLKEIILVIWR